MTAVVTAGAALVAVFAMDAERTDALSCAPRFTSPYRSADVVADGVLLSSATVDGGLISPARLHVTRYLKGRGPGVLRVHTMATQLHYSDLETGVFPELPGVVVPRAGQVWRVFARRKGRRVIAPSLAGGCGPDRMLPVRPVLAPVTPPVVYGTEPRIWRAQLFAGRRGLRCLRFGRRPERRSAYAECGRFRDNRTSLVGVGRRAAAKTTAVAAAARSLSAMTVTRLADGARFEAVAATGVALAVVPGLLERADVLIELRYSDGSRRFAAGDARRATLRDPTGAPAWAADFERAHASGRDRTSCVAVEQPAERLAFRPRPVPATRGGVCGALERDPFYFGVRRSFDRSPDGTRPYVRQTVIVGAIGHEVTGVRITMIDEPLAPAPPSRPPIAFSRRGRAFLAVLAGDVPSGNFGVEFTFADGSRKSYSGENVNAGMPPPY